MPRPPKDPADKLEYGVTVLFTKTDYDAIDRMARKHGMSKGEAVRRLVRRAIRLDDPDD